MSRYLTPPKIGLLALVRLYCEGAISSSGAISILSFIVSHLLPPLAEGSDDEHSTRSFTLPVSEFDKATSTLSSIHPGQSVFDLLIHRLWSIDSFHALHEFFSGLTDLLNHSKERDNESSFSSPPSATVLSRTSPLGAFVRRAQLEFTRLQFNDAQKLWIAFLKYKSPTAAAWKRRSSAASRITFDVNIDELGIGSDSDLFQVAYGTLHQPIHSEELSSTDDIERLLAFQADKLQRLGIRMPHDMKENLRGMVGPASTVPSLSHFVSFFDAWRAGNYTSAFDNLHRYFDYTMQAREKTFYQYALLHMAILQTDFGCLSEAISAINETIATARENQDMSCLNFSLGWLNHLNQAFPHQMRGIRDQGLNGSERDALNFLKLKAKESKMFSLLSSALLSEARLDLSYGERSITKAFQHIYQASHINIRENLSGGFGSQLLMHSAVFGRLGVEHLASAYCDIILKCYRPNVPTEEMLRAICRMSFTAARSGRYEHAIQMLESVRPGVHRTLKFSQTITGYLGLVKLLQAMRRSNRTAAEHILQQLATGFSFNPDLRTLILQLSIMFHIRLGSLSKAFDLIEELANELKEETADISQRLYLLVMKARLYAKAGEPQKGFSVALRAASTAHRFQAFPIFWEAIGFIANILSHLNEFDAARRMLDAVIPQCLENGDTELCALLYSFQADAYMGLAGRAEEAGRRRTACVSKAEVYIDRARQHYKRIEDWRGECEMLKKRAIIARVRGDDNLANDWAAQCLSVHNAAQEKMENIVD
ncbi:anaphase-promoting complex protein [Pseudovirgaria hyperparasitica]|uniref:Anaphase-promoting complex subunit 5 n=1 Tax=Pseudovirgaria hyperparasitica TaxID=470096 RepID=A0A6A6W5I6_9PEZI|nr:anaphase-promoting complex protein [Pseudovirgaria hyperparasitica]KAF2757294.1 anaphase-promoting complex protein [Pseudovirgaria hyperparasitica]